MRLLQLSDPHLLADPEGLCRGRQPLPRLRQALAATLAQLATDDLLPDWLLLSGDLCQDESWGGYVRLRELLAEPGLPAALPPLPPVVLLPGNHDQRLLLRAALGRQATLAPARLTLAAPWRLLLLDSHCPGRVEGRLGARQWAWLERELAAAEREGARVLLALHHPPGPIGDPFLDSIALDEGPALLALLAKRPAVRGVVFGHVHQYWRGWLPGVPGRPLLGCPSTLCAFGPVQPCPLDRAQDPGGLLVELGAAGEIRHRLLRWHSPEAPSVAPADCANGPVTPP
ncbi:MAG: metallophosphoesterase [Cyanobium sp.]